jgi:enoyl-CoA hydratase
MSGGLRVERRGALGIATLDRPEAINALTHDMVAALHGALDEWEADSSVTCIVLRGAGDRGFCAGGDVVALQAAAVRGDLQTAAAFWRDEYRLNLRIAGSSKPIVAIQDGLVLGGGIGLSSHAAYAVTTDRGSLGLPEVAIGFVPDVGGTWILGRAPGRLGEALALTGRRVGPADAIEVGLSAVHVTHDRIDELLAALETDEPGAVLGRMTSDPGPSPLAGARDWIDSAFSHDDVPAILTALRATGVEEALRMAGTISANSPIAVAVALEAVRRARELPSLEAAIAQEFRVSMHAVASHDFAEGVRANLVDKDRRPRWDPPQAGVTPQLVEAYFSSSEETL